MKVLKRSIILIALLNIIWGQQTTLNAETAAQLAEGKQTVAILDFEGRGINQMEAATLTDRLMS